MIYHISSSPKFEEARLFHTDCISAYLDSCVVCLYAIYARGNIFDVHDLIDIDHVRLRFARPATCD